MNGWALLPKFSVAKKTPESKYIGSMTRFMSPLTVSVVVARLATSSPMPAKARAPITSIRKKTSRLPRIGMGKARGRPQEIAPGHGGCNEALEQLADPHIDQEEADPPESTSHGVDPDEARDQTIDLPCSRFGDLNVIGLARVDPAGGLLKDIVDPRASGGRFRSSGVIAVGPRRLVDRHDLQDGLARVQPVVGLILRCALERDGRGEVPLG